MNKRITPEISRRTFLKATAAGVVSLNLGAQISGCSRKHDAQTIRNVRTLGERSKIVLVRNEHAIDFSGNADSRIVQQLVDSALMRFTGEADIARAWRQFIAPGDVVGIKVNAIAENKGPCTKPEVALAIANGLVAAGVPPNNIIIWDKFWEQLEAAGYRINMSEKGVRCFGTNNLGSILGKKIGYLQFNSAVHRFGKVETRFSKIFADYCSAIINVPVLKDHQMAGITLCMKNMYGCIQNPFDYHDNGCNPFIADLNALPAVRAKVRLNVCDCLRGLFHGGPTGKPDWQWSYNGIMVGTDPVALDWFGWQIIEAKRAAQEMPSLAEEGRHPHFIETAADDQHKLGYNDPLKIIVDKAEIGGSESKLSHSGSKKIFTEK
ncbi:DUF362 domain-containing protein [candidate division KSB1 bacterium]|nr:DUF362 domain-containing protein [candidate division KSB1 bacterium]